jgi:putative addiction module component (TIGR02574 family)
MLMSERMKALGIDRMSIEERLALMHEILDSIAEEQEEVALTEAQRTELERRIAASKANPANVVPWEEIKTAALARRF